MDRPFRWVVNVATGEKTQIELTDAEIARDEQNKLAQDAERAVMLARQNDIARRQAILDALITKIERDPTILERIR